MFHTYQWRVDEWMKRTFSDDTRTNKKERACRLLEEALEAFQAVGCGSNKAHELVEYVFNRPVGDPEKEAGGVALTLMAFATAHGFNLHAAAEDELRRVDTPEMIAKIAAKRAGRVVPGNYPKRRVKCSVCDGKGRVFMPGDLHRSAGWEPCGCQNGYVDA